MAKPLYPTPLLDQLESGPWPSFVTGLKRLAKDKDYMVDVLGHLEHSYKTRKGYWKGGTVGVIGYGGGVIPRFTEIKDEAGQQVLRYLGKAWFGPDRAARPVRRHHDAGLHYRERAKGLGRNQHDGLRHGRRRTGGAHLDVLCRRGTLRAVVLRRSQGASHGGQ